jgi:hypothetical protein
MPYATVSIFVLFTGILGWMYFSHHRETRRGRSRLLDECATLLENPKISSNEAGYARLEGLYSGFAVRMMLEEDHIGVRKIPSLWLHLVVKGQDATVAGTLDMLMRPQNTEFYSPSWDWNGHVTPLPGWPDHAIYRTQDEPPDLQKIDASVRRLFSDEKAKELLLMPQSVRLTYQAKQADRGEYLLLRSTAFDHLPLSQDEVRGLLDQAVGIRQDLEGNRNEYCH